MRRGTACNKRALAGAAMRMGLAAVIVGTAAFAARAEDGPVDSALKTLNLKTEIGKMPDFVEKSRPADTDFISIGAQHPQRTIQAKSAKDVKSIEAELDQARARNERVAGRPVTPDPGGPAPQPAKTAKPAKTSKTAKPVGSKN